MNRQTSGVVEGFPALSNRRMVQYAAIGALAGLLFPVLAAIVKLATLNMPITPLNLLAVQRLEPVLWITDTAPFFLGLVAAIAGRQQDRLLQSNSVLRQRE